MTSRKIRTYQNKAENLYTIYLVFDLDGECKFTKEAHMPKPSSIRLAVLVELRLVTDRQTDTRPWLLQRMHSIAR